MLTKLLRLALLCVFLMAPFGRPLAAQAADPQPTPEPAAPQETDGTFTVNNASDLPDASPGDGLCATSNGACTLRAAIQEANANSGTDTINLPAMTFYIGTELAVIYPVTIKGVGQTSTIIDGKGMTRAFRFGARSGPHWVSDLTIQNAVNTSSDTQVERYGGGIFSQADLHLTNVTVKGCKAFEGGGVYNRYYFPGDEPGGAHTMWLNNVTISGNEATNAGEMYFGAGGLFNGSNLYADGLKITGNYAPVQGGGFLNNTNTPVYPNLTVQIANFDISNNVSVDGGGVDVDLGVVSFTNGKISGNTSNCCRPTGGNSTGGGGIYSNFGNLTLTNVEVSNNKATAPQGYGGGIYNAEYMTLVNVSIIGNTAPLGAGIHNGNYLGHANRLSLTNVTISGNRGDPTTASTAEGAAIFNVQAGRVNIVNSTIINNKAQFTGGITDYYGKGIITLSNTILAGNMATYDPKAEVPHDCNGTLTSQGNNLIGDSDGIKTKPCTLVLQSTDLNNVANVVDSTPGSFSIVDLPGLGLQASLTYFTPPTTSPAVDRGNNALCPATDEIGTLRPYNQTCDIGAIEFSDTVGPIYKVLLSASENAKLGYAGAPVIYNLTITNQGNRSDTFNLAVSSPWTVNAPTTVGPLAAGASVDVIMSVHVPANAQGGASSKAAVTVTSQADSSAQSNISLTTTVSSTSTIKMIYLPLACK